MRLRRLLCVLVFSCISLLTVFSGVSIKASAVVLPSGGHYMSPADTLAFIGNSIPATYYNGSQYVDMTFQYQANFTMSDTGYNVFVENSENPVSYMTLNGTPYLLYQGQFSNISLNPEYITAHFQPHYSIFNTDWLYTGFALSSGTSSLSSSVYDSPQSNWYLGGTIHNFYNSSDSTSSSGVKAYLQGSTSWSLEKYTYVPIFNTSSSAFSAYCQDVSFYGNAPNSTYYYNLLVMCPYVSGDASGASGTFSTDSVSSGTDINVNVDVDLTETNGLLGSIISGISGIGDSIKGLFVPDEQDLVDFKEDVADILTDSFSGYSETQDMLDDVRDVLISSNPSAVLEFPALSIPGTHFATPAKSINLNFDNTTIEWVKWIIDIMATIAVVNMIQNKIKAVLVGESVVEVEEIDG